MTGSEVSGPGAGLLDDVGALLVYDILLGKRLSMLEFFGMIVTPSFKQAAGSQSKCEDCDRQYKCQNLLYPFHR
jgi:hypothetical protein